MHCLKIISVTVLLSLLLVACPRSGGDGHSGPDIVIKGLGVDFAAYDVGTGKAGDFIFTESPPSPYKVFFEFGAIVSTGSGTKALPTFEYRIDKTAEVKSIADGVVDRIYTNSGGDFEIIVHYSQNEQFFVVYDHVINITVGVGSTITAGQVLGNPGVWDETYGRFEIMVNNYSTGLSYCPFVYFDPSSRANYEEKVNLFIQEWESFKGDSTIYDEANYDYAGCSMNNMVSY